MTELTEKQISWINLYEKAEQQLKEAKDRVVMIRREMLNALGEKADCDLCGNRHWPTCDERGEHAEPF